MNLSIQKKEKLIEELDKRVKKFKLSRWEKLKKYPFFTIKNFLFNRLIYQVFRNKLVIKKKIKIFFDEKMYVSAPPYEDILYYGVYIAGPEVKLTKFFIKNLQEGNIFFDLGANYGYYGLLASKLIGNSGKVFSFEPDPETLKYLEKNKRDNIEIIPKAVGNFDGEIEFYSCNWAAERVGSTINIKNFENASLSSSDYKKIKVPIISLDTFCFQNNIFPDFIKIDCEGAEEKILLGAKKLLKEYKPIIAMEVYLTPFSDNYRNAINFLLSCGYKIYVISESGDLQRINQDEPLIYFKKLEKFLKNIRCKGGWENTIFIK